MKRTLLTIALFFAPALAFAQSKYEPLIVIQGITDAAGGGSFSEYINFLYAFSISLAALLAVIKIIIAGVKYMMTDVISTKSNAKGEITGALLGLLLILGAYLILNTINPDLTNTKITFQAMPPKPKIFERPSSVTSSTAAADTAAFEDAALSAATAATTGGCNQRTEQVSGLFKTITLDMSGCEAGFDPAPTFSAFSRECMSLGGAATQKPGEPKLITCAISLTTVKSKYGDVAHQRGSWTKAVTFTDSAKVSTSNKTSLQNECAELFGTATVVNSGTINEKISCTYPAVITYSGSQSQYASGDCTDRDPKGTLVESSDWKLGFGVDYYCVIK